jgi:hypothetical protein
MKQNQYNTFNDSHMNLAGGQYLPTNLSKSKLPNCAYNDPSISNEGCGKAALITYWLQHQNYYNPNILCILVDNRKNVCKGFLNRMKLGGLKNDLYAFNLSDNDNSNLYSGGAQPLTPENLKSMLSKISPTPTPTPTPTLTLTPTPTPTPTPTLTLTPTPTSTPTSTSTPTPTPTSTLLIINTYDIVVHFKNIVLIIMLYVWMVDL